jgi:hypothetical protein
MRAKLQFCSLRRRAGTGWARVLWLVLAGLIGVPAAIAGEAAEEAETKSKFLVNFAEFTEWPAGAFASGKAPLIIGILGTDPFGSHLDKLVENETVRGHHLRVLRYGKVEEIKTCHILYISESEESRLDRIVQTMKEKPVLTVSEIENSVARGVIIRMKAEDKKVRLAINLRAAKAAHLTLRAKLLRLGEIVEFEKR